MKWYWGTQMGRRHGQSVWYGLSASIRGLRITLLYVKSGRVTVVTMDELYERLKAS